MACYRLVLRPRFDRGMEQQLTELLKAQGFVQELELSKVYWVLDNESQLVTKANTCERLLKVFCDPLVEDAHFEFPKAQKNQIFSEICFLAGVTDNSAHSAAEGIAIVFDIQNPTFEVHSGWQIRVTGDVSEEALKKVLTNTLANPLLHDIRVGQSLENIPSWNVPRTQQPKVLTYDLDYELLMQLNEHKGLALSESEIRTIVAHFKSLRDDDLRRQRGWAGKITEVELECLAQTWSEHCKHKIFAADVAYSEEKGPYPQLGSRHIQSLYKSYIQSATRELQECGYLVSVFKDNAGIVDFDPYINLCIKVETHNSPSALDPFGGAITGILGVNRDILGCGLGAKPIANMDVFCLSTDSLFPSEEDPRRPQLLKKPGALFRGVHRGVEEGGNQSGIPTINGSFYFASEFAAKPLIFVGSVGVMPKKIQGRPSEEKRIRPGDKIVIAGGRLGKDGVHGATFSSLELKDNVASNVVQIGDSITQKRLLDFTLVARDANLIEAITDNGAGGLSSSIGEMAQLSGGASLDLSRHPVKYPGLEYWEMLVSESQERMSYAVAPEKLIEFLGLAKKMGVEAHCVGEFTASGSFDVFYGEMPVASLNLDFLHDGLERMQLTAHFQGPVSYQEFYRADKKRTLMPSSSAVGEVLEILLNSPNVASREPLIRYYDHEVQGATRLKPYSGRTQKGASDAGVLDLAIHGGEKNNAVAVANGLCPMLSFYDTYLMAQRAVDEAVRNLIATGASPDHMALVDNFCWPDPLPKESNPDAKHKMAQLVRACAGLYEAARIYKAPLVSGKDSMKNDFIGKNMAGQTVKLSVPPTLLVTALGKVPEADHVIPGFFQNEGDRIYLLGTSTLSLWGSVYSQEIECELSSPEYPELEKNRELYHKLHQGIQKRLIHSCHDISDGGLMCCLAECLFGNDLGAEVFLEGLRWENLWSELSSQFIVSVPREREEAFVAHFGVEAKCLGQVTAVKKLQWTFMDETHSVPTEKLLTLWSKGVLNVYHS